MKNLALMLLLSILYLPLCSQIADLPEKFFLNANQIRIEEHLEFEIISQKEILKKHNTTVLVLNEQSQYRELSVSYDNLQKVKELDLIVKDYDGNVLQTLTKKDFEDYPSFAGSLYEDNRFLYTDLNKFSPPYIVELSYLKEYKGTPYLTNFFPRQYGESVLKSSVSVTYPDEIGIQYKVFNSDVLPTTSQVGENQKITWENDNLLAVKFEPYAPSVPNYFPYISIRPNNFHFDGHEGKMEDWDSYNEFYYRINENRDELSEELRTYIKRLTKDLETDIEKISLLYKYLKENMRYVSVQLGIGGWQTFPASYVEDNKYGDCKALSNFMGALLSTVGIRSQKVLIHRGINGYVEPTDDFVNIPFNHAILYLPQEEIYLECTSNNYPLGYLGLDNANRKVMISDINGAIFKETPSMRSNENYSHVSSTIVLNKDGSAIISDSITLGGGLHDEIRFFSDRKTNEEKLKQFKTDFPMNIESTIDYDVKINELEPEVKINYQVNIRKYGSKAGSRFFIPLNPIHQQIATPNKVDNRKLPFTSDLEARYETEITILLPEGYQVESMPSEYFRSESLYVDYIFSCTEEEGKVKVFIKSISKAFHGEAEEYDAFRDELKKLSGLENSKLVLVKKKT